MASTTLCENDIGKKMIFTIKNSSGVVVDVTGATITYFFKRSDGTTLTRTGTVMDGVNGQVYYQFVDGDLIAGHLQVQVSVNITGSTVCSTTVNTVVLDGITS